MIEVNGISFGINPIPLTRFMNLDKSANLSEPVSLSVKC